VPKAFVILAPASEPNEATAQDIFAFARERLAPYKRVRRLEFMPTCPRPSPARSAGSSCAG
jgi:acetyl-CoA synthetase